MNTNYLTQFPEDIFLHITNYLEKSDLYSIQQLNKSLNTRVNELQKRLKELFSTLYILPEGHSTDGHYEISFKDAIDLRPCAQTIKENTLRHLVLDLTRWKEERFPGIIPHEILPTYITSLKILYKLDGILKEPLPNFIRRLKQSSFSLEKICLTPVVSEEEHKKNLEIVQTNSSAIQKDLLKIQRDFSLQEVSFDFPGHTLVANNLCTIEDEETLTQPLKELSVTILDAKETWIYHPKATDLGEFGGIGDISIDYSQNKSTFVSPQELNTTIFRTYNEFRLTVDPRTYTHLKRIFLSPSFLSMETVDRELHEMEEIIKAASLRNIEITLNPTRLYEQMGENKAVLQERLEAFQNAYGVLIGTRAHPHSETTHVIIAPPETPDHQYCNEVLESLSKNPQDAYFRLHHGHITLLNDLCKQYPSSIKKVFLTLYNEKKACPPEDIPLLYEQVVPFISKFPNVQEFYFIPGRLKNDPDIEIIYLYETMNQILATFPEMRLIFCPTLLGYSTDIEAIEHPRFSIDYSRV